MLDFIKRLFNNPVEPPKKITLVKREFLIEEEIPAIAETHILYNCGYSEEHKGFLMIPISFKQKDKI